MDYYEAWQDMSIDDQWFLGDPFDKYGNEISGWHFTLGKEYASHLPFPVSIKIEQEGRMLPVCFGGLNVPYVSQPIKRAILESCTNKIQFIPVTVEKTEFRYYIMNVLNVFSAISKSSSIDYYTEAEWPEKSGKPKYVRELILDKEKIPKNEKIFRLSPSTSHIYIREDIKRMIEIVEPNHGMSFKKIPAS